MGQQITEYYVIKNLSGLAYKVYNLIKLMTKENKTDKDGYVSLSYASIRIKLGNNNNIVRIVDELERHPEIVTIKRGNTCTPNKFKIANNELLE